MTEDGKTIVVTAAGSGVGQSIIKCLQGHGYRIIAVDPSEHAAGFRMEVQGRYRVPLASEGDYCDDIRAICTKEKASMLFPGCDPELFPLSMLGLLVHKEHVCSVMVGSAQAVNLAQDKFRSMELLRQCGIEVARTAPLN